mgnify:CR=1 FL=1
MHKIAVFPGGSLSFRFALFRVFLRSLWKSYYNDAVNPFRMAGFYVKSCCQFERRSILINWNRSEFLISMFRLEGIVQICKMFS